MTFGASLWGAGGFLEVNGVITSWFSTPFVEADSAILEVTFGISECQQIAEALAILFGVRAWAHTFSGSSARLAVRSDSVSALTLIAKLKTKSAYSAVVARELALALAQADVRPHVVGHTPGVANVTADALSRRYQPKVTWTIPAALRGVPELVIEIDRWNYYESARGADGRSRGRTC